MNDDPVRLREGSTMESLRDAIHAARADVPDAARARALEARIVPLVLGPPPSVVEAPPASAAVKTVAAKTFVGISLGKTALVSAIVVTFAGTGALTVVRATRPSPPASSSPLPPPSPIASSLGVPSAPAPVVPEQTPAPSASPVSVKPRATSSPPPGSPEPTDLAAEASLLRRAQDALRSSPADALAFTDEHARRFPRGALAQEREVMAIEALTKLGRQGEAEKRAARFVRTYPESTHRARIDTLLGKEQK